MNLLLSEATEFVKAKTPGLNFLFQSFSAIIFMKKASTFLLKLYITSFCVPKKFEQFQTCDFPHRLRKLTKNRRLVNFFKEIRFFWQTQFDCLYKYHFYIKSMQDSTKNSKYANYRSVWNSDSPISCFQI